MLTVLEDKSKIEGLADDEDIPSILYQPWKKIERQQTKRQGEKKVFFFNHTSRKKTHKTASGSGENEMITEFEAKRRVINTNVSFTVIYFKYSLYHTLR